MSVVSVLFLKSFVGEEAMFSFVFWIPLFVIRARLHLPYYFVPARGAIPANEEIRYGEVFTCGGGVSLQFTIRNILATENISSFCEIHSNSVWFVRNEGGRMNEPKCDWRTRLILSLRISLFFLILTILVFTAKGSLT